MEEVQISQILPATTEIPLNGDSDDSQNETWNEPQNGIISQQESSKSKATQHLESMNKGGQMYFGSSSVGSRLAGEDDSIGSRLASSDVTQPHIHSAPIYKPQVSSNLNKSNSSSKMGFGNTSSPSANPSKLSNLTLQEVQQVAADKAEQMKSWSVKTYKCTKQILSEKLGRGTRTVDLELEAKIEILRDTKRKYENLLMLTKVLSDHFSSIIQTQKVLSSSFAELSAKSQDLQEEFQFNAETQLVVAKNGEKLLSAINFFNSSVATLCSKTMQDTLLTVSKYESARLSFDAYRNELEAIILLPRTESNIAKQATAQANFNSYRATYEKLRDDVGVKLQFLDENRVKVMQKQLLLFHNAISAYFAGNQQQLETTLKQFSIHGQSANSSISWLEKD